MNPSPFTSRLQALSSQGFPRPALLPTASPTSVELGSEVLRSGLFGIDRRRLPPVKSGRGVEGSPRGVRPSPEYCSGVEFRTGWGSAVLTYRGVRLTQAHASVVMVLASALRGRAHTEALETSAGALIAALGWSDSAYSRERLWEALLDLTGAVVVSSYATAEQRQVAEPILARAERERGTGRVCVRFSETGLDLFRGVPVYVSLVRRGLLTEGLETWLYGVIRASRFYEAVTYEYLRDLAGTDQPLNEFARDVRAALVKMRAAKLIGGFTAKRGAVFIWKKVANPIV